MSNPRGDDFARTVNARINKIGELSIGTLILAVLVLIILWCSIFIVSPSQMAGTRWMGGKITSAQPIGPGVHFKVPFFTSVDKIQTSRSVYTLPQMQVYSNDNQVVTIDISVIYQIPSNAVLKLLYGTGRAGSADVDDTILPVIRDRALAAFAKHNTLNISDERQQIADQMHRDVGEALERLFGINVIDVQLTDISYSEAFTKAVEAAVKAKADSVQAENAVAQKKYEGEQRTVTADAEAKAEVARANGAAQATVLAADAQAKAIATVGAALKANPEYAHFYGLQHWNGVMPAVVGGGSSFLVDPSRYLGGTSEASAK